MPDIQSPVSHSSEKPFYANVKVIAPISISILVLLGLIGIVLLIRRRSKYSQLHLSILKAVHWTERSGYYYCTEKSGNY